MVAFSDLSMLKNTLDSCGGDGGVKTISRVIDHTYLSSTCPPTTLSVKCNAAPCAFSNNATIIAKNESDNGGDDGDNKEDSGSSDLTLLWAIIGVVAGVAIIGGIYWYIRSHRRNSPNLISK